MEADIKPAKDRGESASMMEPLLIGQTSRHRPALTDLALDLAQKSVGFRRSLPESLLARLQTVRITMSKGFDSLNVAAASAIALHHFSHR